MPTRMSLWNACWCAAIRRPVVVNLDIPVVEEPEAVYWVDPIHPDPRDDKN